MKSAQRVTRPKVTAVIICRNHAPFVEKAIKSALNQTHKNIQLIVFENDSKYGGADTKTHRRPWFQFIEQENTVLIRTLNAGLGLAGENIRPGSRATTVAGR